MADHLTLLVRSITSAGPVEGTDTYQVHLAVRHPPEGASLAHLIHRTSRPPRHNVYTTGTYTPPPAGLTAFQAVSARRWRLIRRGSTGALAPPFTLGAGSAHQPIHGTVQHWGSWQRTPA